MNLPTVGINPKDLIGVTKAPVALVPPVAIIMTARAMAVGAKKYGEANWREIPIKRRVYLEAALRHIYAALDGEEIDPETDCPHIAHVCAGMSILMDADANGASIGWKTVPGKAADVMRKLYPPKA